MSSRRKQAVETAQAVWYRRWAVAITTIAAIVVTVSVLTAPLFINALADVFGLRPSEIAAGYEATSALLSAVALCALAVSLWYQVKQTRVSQNEAARAFQLELVKMALADEGLTEAAGWATPGHTLGDEVRRRIYLNQWFMYMQMNFETDGLSEPGVRSALRNEFFVGEGAQFWGAARDRYRNEAAQSWKKMRFVDIVDSEYHAHRERTNLSSTEITAPQPSSRSDEMDAQQAVCED